MGVSVPDPELRVSHLSDAEFEVLVQQLPAPGAVSRAWVETALVHPSYLRDFDSQLTQRDPAVILLRAMEQAGEAALGLCLTELALLDLDLATPSEANVAVRLARQGDPLKRIAETRNLARLAAYGRVAEGQLANPHAEAKWLTKLGSAFLGACALGDFQNAEALVRGVVELNELTPRTIDSHKTVLQELASKRGLPQPVYSLIEASGPDHERVFEVRVTVGKLRAQGEGTSKKRAEEAAARRLLTLRMPGAGNPVGAKARPQRQGKKFEFARLSARERESFEGLASRLGVPRSASALARAFVHASYAFEKGLRLDETNQALALLGSAVLSAWATRLQLASLAGRPAAEAPEVLTTAPWDVSVCAEAAREMGLDRCLLVGRGEKDPSQRIVGEAFQATVGALYVELGDPSDVAERMPEAIEILRSSFLIGWLDTKTELERRLGPSRISINYVHEEHGPDHKKEYKARAVLSSRELDETMSFRGSRWAASKTEAEKAVAAEVLRALIDPPAETNRRELTQTGLVQGFVARHEVMVVPDLRSQVAEWYRRGALGTALLRQESYHSFLAWTELLGPIDEAAESRLRIFYQACRESAGMDQGQVTEAVRRVAEWVDVLSVDSSSLGAMEAPAFRALMDLAALTRLASTPSVVLKVASEIEDFALLGRTHGREVQIGSMPDAEILGVEGALPMVLGRLTDHIWGAVPPSLRIEGRMTDQKLIVTMECSGEVLAEAELPGEEDSLFTFLRDALGIVQVRVTHAKADLVFRLAPGSATLGDRLLAAFLSPPRLPDSEGFEIARVVHDLKNEIVAFGASLQRWSEAAGNETSRLRLQYESAQHLEAARGLASSLATLTSSLTSPRLEELDLVLFLQEYLSQKILEIPASVRLVTPRASLASLAVLTARGYLRSILDNLIKNAVEAMPDGGDLAIDWAFDEAEHMVILEVSDTGEGMDPTQVAAVGDGTQVESTKRTGSALGLATVRGMVRRLDGSIDVSSTPGKGTSWTLTLPDLREQSA